MSQFAVVGFDHGDIDVTASLWNNLGRALDERDALNKKAKAERNGWEWKVFRLAPVEETHEYEWGVRHNQITTDVAEYVAEYVNEHAARACCRPGDDLLRRRAGTEQWFPAPKDPRGEG